MLIKLFGIADLIVALAFLINNWFDNSGWFPNQIVLYLAIYLLIKGIFFLMTADFASAIDVVAAVVIILSFYIHIPLVLSAVVFIFVVQKAILSLIY